MLYWDIDTETRELDAVTCEINYGVTGYLGLARGDDEVL